MAETICSQLLLSSSLLVIEISSKLENPTDTCKLRGTIKKITTSSFTLNMFNSCVGRQPEICRTVYGNECIGDALEITIEEAVTGS